MDEINQGRSATVKLEEAGENRVNSIYLAIAELQTEISLAEQDGRLTIQEISSILERLSWLDAILRGHLARLAD